MTYPMPAPVRFQCLVPIQKGARACTRRPLLPAEALGRLLTVCDSPARIGIRELSCTNARRSRSKREYRESPT